MPSLPRSVTASADRLGGPEPELVSWKDLRNLAEVKGSCISAVVAMQDSAQVRTHLKKAVHEIEKRVTAMHLEPRAARGLMKPIETLAANIESDRDWAFTIVLYRSPELFRYFTRREVLADSVTIGERFQVRPLLAVPAREQFFYLLALSQKHVRLFRCTQHRLEVVPLGGHAPPNLHTWMNTSAPDHMLRNRTAAGAFAGSSKGVVFGTSADRERPDAYLLHYFGAIDQGVHEVLNGETAPLILAAVESEIALYREVNSYPKLLESSVHGSPDAWSSNELHMRALEIVKRVPSEALAVVLKNLDEHRRAHRISFDVDEIVKAAFEGRVEALLIREDAERRGIWNPAGQRVQAGGEAGENNLFNLAALQTLTDRGQVFELKAEEMPEGSDAAAVFRY